MAAIVRKYKLKEMSMEEAEVRLTLYNAALAEKERCSVPMLGHSTDRRTLAHVGEVFREDNVHVLMCFLCACKEISHTGYDKFGKAVQKGNICYRSHKEHLRQIIIGDQDRQAAEAWQFNLSAKRLKDKFGQAVSTDPIMQSDCFHWQRKVRRRGTVEHVLCCPEDVIPSTKCRHDETYICEQCQIPICNECYVLSLKKQKIPRALTNDNFIGFVHPYIVENKVTWLEATIACPVFSGLVTYYIEGDSALRGHMMREPLGRPQRAWAVRGNIF